MSPRASHTRLPEHVSSLGSRFILISALGLFLSIPARGATYTVNPQGTGPFSTIQAAIDAAAPGDTIALDDGIFVGAGNCDIRYHGKAITVRSLHGDPDLCAIDCRHLQRAFYFHDETSLAVLEGVTIRHGGADKGAGIYLDGSAAPRIINCAVVANVAEFGGGISMAGEAHPAIEGCRFTGNSADRGGGIYSSSMADLLIRGCEFNSNQADYGAGIGVASAGNVQITDCYFRENDAIYNGGGLWCRGGMRADLLQCTFVLNGAGNKGGGIALVVDVYARVVSCTLVENGAAVGGGGVGCFTNAYAELENAIIAFGLAGQAVECGSGSTVIATCCDLYSNAGGDWIGGVAGQEGVRGNFAGDPLFCDLIGEDFGLLEDSPCAPAVDPSCGLIGAWAVGCETPPGPRTYIVCPDGSGDFPTIQAAVSSCRNGDTVELADGIFEGPGNRDVYFTGMTITVRSLSRNPAACVLRCGGANGDPHRAFCFDLGEGPGHIVEGIGFEGGHATELGPDGPDGGAILCSNGARPTFRRCRFADSVSEGNGGAVAASGSSFEHCVFENNCATADGGAVHVSGEGRFYGCSFLGNHADRGGALVSANAQLDVQDCACSGNGAQDEGGAIRISGGTATLTHSLFESNIAGYEGGALFLATGASLAVTDCRLVDNEAAAAGGAISSYSALVVDQSTMERNSGGAGHGGGVFSGLGTFEISRSLFCGNLAPQGGALAQGYGDGSISQCTLYGNHALLGAGVWASAGDVQVTRAIIANSTAGTAVHCVYGGNFELECCDIHGNAGGDYVGCAAEFLGVSGNISADPLFCDATGGDFGLMEASPCAPFSPSNPGCDLVGAFDVGCVLTGVPEEAGGLPHQVSLGPPCPSPFAQSTQMTYAVPLDAAGRVKVRVFDAGGRLVQTIVDGLVHPGWHALSWDGRSGSGELMGSGIYYVRVETCAGTAHRQVLRVR